ncbi:Nn.00g095050.m01.CDS01 [Neocucurbitaria sp. VM-36]
MSKSCLICGGDETEGDLLVEAPCGRHWVCADDISTFFEHATTNESLFPPKCCGQMFMLHEYEDYIPFETAWAYQVKEQGEYAILPKFRIYCANPPCAKFLHPTSHVEDPETKITYAICESEDCGKLTCCACKTLLDHGTQNHTCQQNEDEKKFKQTATEKGYKECFICGAIVELAEACNHITCECGHDFCYVCGKDWPGLHGCPHYGPATYDEEGYNQDGFHRDTGLNRDGLTRRQDLARARAEADPDEDEDDDEGEEEDEDPDWDVLQHLDPEQRIAINVLDGEARDDALDQHRIELMETRGIIFNQGQHPPQIIGEAHDSDDEEGAEDADDEDIENRDPQDHQDDLTSEEAQQGEEVADDQLDENLLPEPELDEARSVGNQAQAPITTEEEQGHIITALHGLEQVRDRASSSSEEELNVRPATPMDIDEIDGLPVERTEQVEGGNEVPGAVQVLQAPPGAWVDEELL